MVGINVKQFKTLVRSTLKDFSGSENVVNLVVGTCIAESGLSYLAQVDGPALGVCQMEPATFWDIKQKYLAPRIETTAKIKAATGANIVPDELVWNLKLAIIMCRLRYILDPQPIPSDAAGLAEYHKRVYNTYLGKANAATNIPFFETAINA